MSLNKNIRNGLILAATIYGGGYLIFIFQVHRVQSDLEREASSKEAAAISAKQDLDAFVSAYPWRRALKDRHLDAGESLTKKNERVSVLFYDRMIEREIPVPEYWFALREKLEVEEVNERLRQDIKSRLQSDLAEYLHAKDLIGSLDVDRFALNESASATCIQFFPGTSRLSINEQAMSMAPVFGKATTQAWAEAKARNAAQSVEYEGALRRAQAGLTPGAYQALYRESEQSGVLKQGTHEASFSSPLIGTITYQVPTVEFRDQAFEDLLAKAYRNMYANNSLSTGNKPWAYCYGSYNNCGGYGCSEIQVRSGGSDVVVTIKDRKGEVIRHAYIRRNSSYAFHMPNGRYQPFFYYGNGWNPNKEMKRVSCGILKGGFISGEHVGKDDYQYLNNNILTYTLVETTGGNFNTSPSSTNEAL
jgi:hypothetical protein